MNYANSIRLLWVVLFFVSACKKNKFTTTTTSPSTNHPTTIEGLNDNTFFNEVIQKELDFTTLSAKAETAYNDGLVQQDFTTAFRIKKDSLIWLSLQGPFGIEGMRMLIRPDSFFVDNKLNGEKIADNTSNIIRYTNVPVDFQSIQRMLVGQLLKGFSTTNNQLFNDSTQLLFQQSPKNECYSYIHLKNYTPQEIVWKDLLQGIQMKINFDEYKTAGNSFFSYRRNYVITHKENKKVIDMIFSKVKINEQLTFPF